MGAKLKAMGKAESGLLACQAKIAVASDPNSINPACAEKVKGKFTTAFGRAGACAGVEADCEDIADSCEAAVAAAMTDTLPSKCEAAKRKVAAKLAKSEVGCYSKAAKKDVPVDSACITKAQVKFGAALTKAGACPDGGSPQTEVEGGCVQPAVITDGGGMVTDVCPPCGTFLTKWGTLGSGDGQFNNPIGVATDASGNVFVTDLGNHRVQKFTNTGTFVTKWGTSGIGDGQFQTAWGVAVDGSGDVFVTDFNRQRLQKFDPNGLFLTAWGTGGNPEGVAVDMSGQVFVAEPQPQNNRIAKFDPNGVFLTAWGSVGSGDGQFIGPSGVAVDASANVLVTDSGNNRIEKFDPNGVFLAAWGTGGSGNSVTVDASGSVFVAESGLTGIEKFDPNGVLLTAWGGMGSGDGQFNLPLGVAVDASGNVFVADSGNNRIQKFVCP